MYIWQCVFYSSHIVFMFNTIFSEIKKNKLFLLVFLVWFCLWLYRLFYFLNSSIPLWYDPGIYKYYFHIWDQILHFQKVFIPAWLQYEPWLGIFVNVLNMFGISFDSSITWWIGLASFLPGLILFFLFRKQNKWLALVMALLYRISIVQYETFLRCYYKQIVAISFMLLALYFVQSKKYIVSWIFLVLLFFFHKSTSLFTVGVLWLYLIYQMIQSKKIPWKLLMSLGVLWWLWLLLYWQIAPTLLKESRRLVTTTFGGNWFAGDFLSRWQYFANGGVVIILGIVACLWKIYTKKIDIFFRWVVFGLLWTGLQLANYKRFFTFLDMLAIINAGQLIIALYDHIKDIKTKRIWNMTRVWFLFFVIFGFSILSYKYVDEVKLKSHPFIVSQEFEAIKQLSVITESNAIIIDTHRNYTPWIMWYTSRDRISPGMTLLPSRLEKDWENNRVKWWRADGPIKCQMLQEYKKLWRPLYLWIWQQQFPENLQWQNCLVLYREGITYSIWKVK